MHAHRNTHQHTHTHTCGYEHTHIHLYRRVNAHAYTHAQILTHIHRCTHRNAHSHAHTHAYTWTQYTRSDTPAHTYIHTYIHVHTHTCPLTHTNTIPVGWGNCIHRLHLYSGVGLPNKCPGYDTKQSDGEAPVTLELWGNTEYPSLQSLLGPLQPGVVAPDRILSFGQIEQFDI